MSPPSKLDPGPFEVQPVGVNSQPASWAEWPLEPRKHGQHPSECSVQLKYTLACCQGRQRSGVRIESSFELIDIYRQGSQISF